MVVATRKYNPGFLTVDELIATFCVRMAEFESLLESVRECSGNANSHQIVIGPRGSGKTSLLLRVAAELERDSDLSVRFFPIIFAEESYEVSTAGEFWLECISRLAAQVPRVAGGLDLHRTFEDLRTIRDDRLLEGRCLGVLQDFADREAKRLVLVVENLNMMFGDISDRQAGWRLRKILQTDPRIVLLASATSRFDQMSGPEEAFYELFRVIQLRPLDLQECTTLWLNVTGQARAPQTVQALRILTGGSPRLLTIVARFGANLSFSELMDDLLDLVDDHTEYFKSHLDALPAQERRVYLALADLWKPASAREIADRARLETSQCSAQLARLTDRGVVEVSGGSPRRKLYYLTERLYNIYYLMRRARGPVPLVDALVRFMAAFYSTNELKEFGARMLREAQSADQEVLKLIRTAFNCLVGLPSLEVHREEFRSLAPPNFLGDAEVLSSLSLRPSTSRELFIRALTLAEGGQLREAIAAWEETVQRFGESDARADQEQVSLALANKGRALERLGKAEEALDILEDVVRRYGKSKGKNHELAVASALVSKGRILDSLNRQMEALEVCDEVVRRFGDSRVQAIEALVANALVGKAATLYSLERFQDSLETDNEVLCRFRRNSSSKFFQELAAAMVGRGHALLALNRIDEAIEAWTSVVRRFGTGNSTKTTEQVAAAHTNIGVANSNLGRFEEALAAYQKVVQIHEASDSPILREATGYCLLNRGNVQAGLNLAAEALSSWDEAIKCFRLSASPDVADPFSTAMMNKASALIDLGQMNEALDLLGELVERFEEDDRPKILITVANAQTTRGAILEQLERHEEALDVWQKVEDRFGNSDLPECVALVAKTFVHMCANLHELNRLDEVIVTSDRAVTLFGKSHMSVVVDAVTGVLFNKGIALVSLNRNEDALVVWDEIERRLGHCSEPEVLKQLVAALVAKGTTLARMNRLDDAIGVWSDVLGRFSDDESPMFDEELATAVLNRVQVLGQMQRTGEAIEACEEALQWFESNDEFFARVTVAKCLVYNGAFLLEAGRAEEGLKVWDDAVGRFEASEEPLLRDAAESALYGRAVYELNEGRAEVAIVLLDQALVPGRVGIQESRMSGHLLRALAHLEESDLEACTNDVNTALLMLAEIDSFQRETLKTLADLAVGIGMDKMLNLIKPSPVSNLLRPLTTALELELGLEPRVAREIEEVAEDVRRDLLAR